MPKYSPLGLKSDNSNGLTTIPAPVSGSNAEYHSVGWGGGDAKIFWPRVEMNFEPGHISHESVCVCVCFVRQIQGVSKKELYNFESV